MRNERGEKKKEGGRQAEAPTAIYPMQSEIIAYHSAAPVSSVKAPRRARRGARPDPCPWETIGKMQPRLLHFLSSRIKTHLGVTGHRGYPPVSLGSMQFNLTSGSVYITFTPQHHRRWRKSFLPKKKENKAFHPNTVVLKVGETQNPCYPAV